MVSSEAFIEEYKDKTYEELIEVRNELIKDIKKYESNFKDSEEFTIVCPSPELVYQMNHEYLSELCMLIAEKFGEKEEI